MARRVDAIVKAELLKWARNSAGLDFEAAAKKIPVKPERLEAWERGDLRPTIKQLRKLGRAYKRPMAVFYLPEPPMDFQALRDFRRLPDEAPGYASPELRFEMRRAQNRREVAIELFELIEEEPASITLSANLWDDPESVGEEIREFLGITHEKQTGWRSGYDALNNWKAALEESGILVFQAGGISVGEMRGFSISDSPVPAIVVNIRDSLVGRVFTMLHELTHIALREGGLCDLNEDPQRHDEEERIEVFCNHVAGAALVPRKDLLEEPSVTVERRREYWTDEEISLLARSYGASREALLRRLLLLGLTSQDFYRAKREQYRAEYRAAAMEAESLPREGFPLPHTRAVSSAGRLFVRLVLNNYYQDNITASDVSDFLEVRLKHLSRIEATVF